MAIVFDQMDEHAAKAFWEDAIGDMVSVNSANKLYYSIARQILWGTINGSRVGPFAAQSGGGQTGVGKPGVSFAKVNPSVRSSYATKAEIAEDNRGGAIPPGLWAVEPQVLANQQMSGHSMWGGAPTGHSLRLWPLALRKRYAKDARHSFYIHGTGGKGSDGCILMSPHDRKSLVRLVADNGGALLRVYLSGRELNDQFDRSDLLNRTA